MSRFFTPVRILRVFFFLLLIFSLVYAAQLRRHRMIEEFPVGKVDPGKGFLGPPLPPPKVDPGPDAATLDVVVLDRDTGEQLSATVSVNGGIRNRRTIAMNSTLSGCPPTGTRARYGFTN